MPKISVIAEMPDEPEAPGSRSQTSQLQGRTTEMEQHKIPSQRDDVITQLEQDSDRERPRKMLRVDIQHKPQDRRSGLNSAYTTTNKLELLE